MNHRLWFIAALLATNPARPALAGGAGYETVLAEDGAYLMERWKLERALCSTPADATRCHELVAAISAHVNYGHPQVISDFQDGRQRVEIPPAPHLDYREAFTWALWLRLEVASMARETKIISHAGVNAGKVTIMGDGRRVDVLIRYDDGASIHLRAVPEVARDRWVHLAVSCDRLRGPRIVIDGEPAAVRMLAGDILHRARIQSLPEQAIYLGGFDRAFPGRLDDVRLYDRALSDRELVALSEGRAVNRGLIGHWPFDDLRGAPARDVTGFATDGVVGAGVAVMLPGRIGFGVGFARDAAQWARELDELESELDLVKVQVLQHARAAPWEPIDVPALRAALRAQNATLVHIVEDSSRQAMTAWVVPPEGEGRVVSIGLPLSPAWQESRRALGNELRAAEPGPADDARVREAARAVARELWDPLEEFVGAGGEVWLRLPVSLRGVPFAALLDRDGRFLVERYAFARCGPVRALLRRAGAENRPGGPRLVAVANPCAYTIDKDSPSAHPADAASSRIHRAGMSGCTIVGAPLNGARREVDALAQQVNRYGFASAEIYDWGMAQEELFDSCVVGADVVHIATHGYRIARDCLPVAPRDPLVLSGVVLAGASRIVPDGMRGGNEGFLSAAEVAGLNLSAARLVFWSACATADGDPLPNESVSGLSAAGWLAGAEATVATLWLVSDETTPRQVEAFYQQWLAGRSPARALQGAHIGGLKAAREADESTHPALWAAWVVDGL